MTKPMRTVASPPREKPLLLYDGECGFCQRWARRGERIAGHNVDFIPFEQAVSRFPEIPEPEFLQAVQLIECDGRAYSGAEAVVRVLAMQPVLRALQWLYDYLPGFSRFSEWLYGVIARNRARGCTPNSCR